MTDQMTTGNERCEKAVDKRESKKRKMEEICEMKGKTEDGREKNTHRKSGEPGKK